MAKDSLVACMVFIISLYFWNIKLHVYYIKQLDNEIGKGVKDVLLNIILIMSLNYE